MFTGIIEHVGRIAAIEKFAMDVRLQINVSTLFLDNVKIGDSIAVNGACLTVVTLNHSDFSVDVSAHTLQNTTLGRIQQGQAVNLEKCLQLSSYIGGHLVTGHVDGIAQLVEKKKVGRTEELVWRLPTELLPFVAVKGSIALAGISLTVNAVQDTVSVVVIPHTLEQTTLAELAVGEEVNVEVDLLARYVARWLTASPK